MGTPSRRRPHDHAAAIRCGPVRSTQAKLAYMRCCQLNCGPARTCGGTRAPLGLLRSAQSSNGGPVGLGGARPVHAANSECGGDGGADRALLVELETPPLVVDERGASCDIWARTARDSGESGRHAVSNMSMSARERASMQRKFKAVRIPSEHSRRLPCRSKRRAPA